MSKLGSRKVLWSKFASQKLPIVVLSVVTITFNEFISACSQVSPFNSAIITLCAYAQQGYVFGHVGLCAVYVRICVYIYIYVYQQKNDCLVPYCSKISC